MRQEKLSGIKEELNKAIARWWGRKRAIKAIIANANDAQKQQILEDAVLLARLDSKLRRDEMRTVLNNLDASIYSQIQVMHRWEGRYLPEIITLLESASEAEKGKIANNTAILSHIVASYREDYQLEVIKHLNLLAAGTFTNKPNNDKFSFTSLMVLFQDKLVIGKEVNFVPAGTFVDDKIGFEVLKTRFIAAVTNHLSEKYKLKIESAHEEQDAQALDEYPIIVKLAHNPAADYRLILYGGTHGRGGLSQFRGEIYEFGQEEEDERWVPDVYLAHEAAHLILGADEEYAPEGPQGIWVHQDNSLMGNFYVEGIKEAEIKARNFQFLVPLLKSWFPDRTIRVVPETRAAGHLSLG